MMHLEKIIDENDAAVAEHKGYQPVPVRTVFDVKRQTKEGLPILGSYVPDGWELAEPFLWVVDDVIDGLDQVAVVTLAGMLHHDMRNDEYGLAIRANRPTSVMIQAYKRVRDEAEMPYVESIYEVDQRLDEAADDEHGAHRFESESFDDYPQDLEDLHLDYDDLRPGADFDSC